MKLETKITERDKKLLVFLAVFLLIVGFLMLIILPACDTASALREEITVSAQSKEQMDAKIEKLSNLKQEKTEMEEQWEMAGRRLYQKLETQDIDKIVTDEVLKQGLKTKSLKISVNKNPPVPKKYLADDSDEESEDTGEDGAKDEDISGIYTASVSLSVEGDREKIRSLTDRFADDYLAVRVLSMKYDTKEVIDDEGMVKSLNTILDMELEFYMCEK